MAIPTGANPAGFLLPTVSFYGILWQERNGFQRVSSSKLKAILLLFDYFSCLDLPHFASICEVMILASVKMTRFDITADAAKHGGSRQIGGVCFND